jgi:hypothetical protein
MALPKIDLPIFELQLKSVDEPVKFRPFLVKEEKLLLMALQADDEDAIIKTIKQVINNCLVSDIDIDKLPIFDIEYLFLNVRARSMGEMVETYFVCKNVVGNEKADDGTDIPVECAHMMPVKINLLEIKPPDRETSTKIMITDKIGIQMTYPSLQTLKYVDGVVSSDDMNKVFDLVYECADYIFDEAGMYYVKESDRQEFDNFLSSLTQEQFDRVIGFFDRLPKIEHDVEHKCQKCGFDHKLHLEGLNDFFT